MLNGFMFLVSLWIILSVGGSIVGIFILIYKVTSKRMNGHIVEFPNDVWKWIEKRQEKYQKWIERRVENSKKRIERVVENSKKGVEQYTQSQVSKAGEAQIQTGEKSDRTYSSISTFFATVNKNKRSKWIIGFSAVLCIVALVSTLQLTVTKNIAINTTTVKTYDIGEKVYLEYVVDSLTELSVESFKSTGGALYVNSDSSIVFYSDESGIFEIWAERGNVKSNIVFIEVVDQKLLEKTQEEDIERLVESKLVEIKEAEIAKITAEEIERIQTEAIEEYKEELRIVEETRAKEEKEQEEAAAEAQAQATAAAETQAQAQAAVETQTQAAAEAQVQAAAETQKQAQAAAETQTQATAQAQAQPNETQKVGEMVWITATGAKYHSHNSCGNTNSARASRITLSEGTARGYTACKKCY